MNNTEDDTFKRLTRTPFSELIGVIDSVSSERIISTSVLVSIIELHNWNYEEFIEAYNNSCSSAK